MSFIGKASVENYLCEEGEFEDYLDRIDYFIHANKITDAARKRFILLSILHSSYYKTLKSLVYPENPRNCAYDDLIEHLRNHYCPAPTPVMSRWKFNRRSQLPEESVAQFVAALRKIAENCNFGVTLNDMLRDRLQQGVRNKLIQQTILDQEDQDFGAVYKKAVSMETTAKEMKMLSSPEEEKQLNSKPRPSSSASSQQDEVQATSASSDVNRMQFRKNYNQRKPSRIPRPKPNYFNSHSRQTNNSKFKPRGERQESYSSSFKSQSQELCFRCKKGYHNPNKCWHKKARCKFCRRYGHIEDACFQKEKTKKSTHNIQNDDYDDSGDEYDYEVFSLHQNRSGSYVPPLKEVMNVNGVSIEMEIDTGSSNSIICETVYSKYFKNIPIEPVTSTLSVYNQTKLELLGKISVTVNGKAGLSLLVVKDSGPNLIGRDWLACIKLDWKKFAVSKNAHQDYSFHVTDDKSKLEDLLKDFDALFDDSTVGKLEGYKANIVIDKEATPKFCKARTVPYALKDKIDTELARLENNGIIRKVQFSDWASPIVPVSKPNGDVRICADFKSTINQHMQVDKYPLPTPEDLFTKLAPGKLFSKLDLSHAYNQIVLDDESQKVAVINTHKGLYSFCRLPFGAASSAAIFQRSMDSLLADVDNVVIYQDDVLVTGTDSQSHLQNLQKVFQKLSDAGLKLKKEKCSFLNDEITYLGHRINAQGIMPSSDKLDTIVQAESPNNVQQLQAYLGMINFYRKYVHNMANVLSPLYKLLKKGAQWTWTETEQRAFEKSKVMLVESPLLVHYDTTKPLIITSDASSYGIGSVLSHKYPDGSERPIAFASRVLNPAECNYSQLEKEGLALIYGVKKFHKYLFGRSFEIITDHKPLLGLLGENHLIPAVASARITRWALMLAAYSYHLMYRPGKKIAPADFASRFPSSKAPNQISQPDEIQLIKSDEAPIDFRKIKMWTTKDKTIMQVLKYMKFGWNNEDVKDDVKPYFNVRDELSCEDNVLMRGLRVVIPESQRKDVMKMLHDGHPGICRMKAIARSFMWWPGIDHDLEMCVKKCEMCQNAQNSPPKATLHPWEWPGKPWYRIHIDLAGPVMGKELLIIVDAHTKCIDVIPLTTTTSRMVIESLRRTFATFGLPTVLVSDNGRQFVSEEFELFCTKNGIKHVTSSSYHPSSNGLAERGVQTVKKSLEKIEAPTLDIKVQRFLFNYRNTPQSSTNKTPAYLMFGRELRSHFSLIHKSVSETVLQKQDNAKNSHDFHAKDRHLNVNDHVIIENFVGKPKWFKGQIVKIIGPLTYEVRLENGRIVKKHVDHLKIVDRNECSENGKRGDDHGKVDNDQNKQRQKRNVKAPKKLNL